MDKKQLEAFARDAAKGLKTDKDLAEFSQMLTKITVEVALNAELDDHPGYERHQASDDPNSRNGCTSQTVKNEDGQFELDTSRDRHGSFEPQLGKKTRRCFPSMVDKILSLFAKGMTNREIVPTFKEMYDADISATSISKVTKAVIGRVDEWQSRPLEAVYLIVYLDCIVVKVRQDKQNINKVIHLALVINLQGHKELLGMWLPENEGAKLWLGVLAQLQNHGVRDILIACVDRLKRFPDAISAVYPQAQIQLCIVHMVRKSMKYVPYKDYKLVSTNLTRFYQSATEQDALLELEQFESRRDGEYLHISRTPHTYWPNLNTLFRYPEDVRRDIYTTNVIESLNSEIRKAIYKRKLFPTDDLARTVLYLVIMDASKKWTMPIRDRKPSLNRFIIKFENRITGCK